VAIKTEATMADDPTHPLQPTPDQSELRLEPMLEQVRDETSISDAEVSELMRIEEALSYANEVAKQTISPQPGIGDDSDAPPPS
jgi:hypothetical protein